MRKLMHLVRLYCNEQYRKEYELKVKFMRIMKANKSIMADYKG